MERTKNKTGKIKTQMVRKLIPIAALFGWLTLLSLTFAQSALAALVWELRTVDSAGAVGSYASLAIDGNGRPVISYYDDSNADLKLVHCGDSICKSGNLTVTVDSVGRVGQHTSLMLDALGRPVISYYDESNLDLKLVHCGNADCTSGNLFQVVDDQIEVMLGGGTSLKIDNAGRPVMSYFDTQATGINLARCGDPNCSSGNTIQPIDASAGDSSLVLDSAGNPVISYEDVANADLKLAHCVDATCSSGTIIHTVDGNLNVGFYSSLQLDRSGRPIISYFNASTSDLKLARCGDVNCSAGNSLQTVDQLGIVGLQTSLDLDSNDRPVISYQDSTNSNLKLVQCGNTNCSSNNIIQVVDQLGLVGQFPSLVLDANNHPIISYFDTTNRDLKLARLVDDGTGALPPIILGSTTSGKIGGVSFGDEDMLRFDPLSNQWSKFFDASDVGLKANDVDAFALDGSTLLLSFELSSTIAGLGVVEPNDIVRFTPTSLGETTSGSFQWFLDGSDVGLDTLGEDIDALEFLPNQQLIISTRGSYSATGIIGEDQDLIVLNNATFGANSAGTWSLYFDGSDVGLTDRTEDIRGVGINERNDLFLNTDGVFNVPEISGDASDIFICTPGSLGENSSCTYRLFFDGDVHGFGDEDIDGFDLAPSVTLSSVDSGDTSIDDLNEDDHGDVDEQQMGQQIFLPMMRR